MKLGYGIKGNSGTIFQEITGEADAVKFLRGLDGEVAYAFVVDKTGEARDLVAGVGVSWKEKIGD